MDGKSKAIRNRRESGSSFLMHALIIAQVRGDFQYRLADKWHSNEIDAQYRQGHGPGKRYKLRMVYEDVCSK